MVNPVYSVHVLCVNPIILKMTNHGFLGEQVNLWMLNCTMTEVLCIYIFIKSSQSDEKYIAPKNKRYRRGKAKMLTDANQRKQTSVMA